MEKKRKKGCTVSDRPICFKKYTPPAHHTHSLFFVRSSVSFVESFARAFARRSFVGRNRARFVRFVRAKRRVFDVSTSFTHVASRRVRTNLTNKTSLKEKGGDVENAPEEKGHSFFTLLATTATTHARTRDGTEDEDYQSPSLSRCISLSTTRENKSAVS